MSHTANTLFMQKIEKKRESIFNWSVQDLAILGVFSAATKISSIMITLVGGGPNPLGFIIKNMIFTTMLIIMLSRVRKIGTLTLFACVNLIVSMLLMGTSITTVLSTLTAAFIAEFVVVCLGGIQRSYGVILAVFLYDLSSKIASLAVSYLAVRETPALMIPAIILMTIGYIGCIIGLFTGAKSVKELEQAGFIRS